MDELPPDISDEAGTLLAVAIEFCRQGVPPAEIARELLHYGANTDSAREALDNYLPWLEPEDRTRQQFIRELSDEIMGPGSGDEMFGEERLRPCVGEALRALNDLFNPG
jgi:hypothetical protein